MTITAAEFRNALREFVTGVTVITVKREDNSVHGMTANSFTSVSLDPLEILVCVDRRAHTHTYIQERRHFAVNILAEDQEAFARFFSKVDQNVTLAQSLGVEFHTSARGTPVLAGSLVQLDCVLISAFDGGDHTIFVAEVVELSARAGQPLLFHAGQYKRLSDRVQI
jgi:flavin reductase (DIM6/NTAB) family NADH-FMN oxidoreductase RutF